MMRNATEKRSRAAPRVPERSHVPASTRETTMSQGTLQNVSKRTRKSRNSVRKRCARTRQVRNNTS